MNKKIPITLCILIFLASSVFATTPTKENFFKRVNWALKEGTEDIAFSNIKFKSENGRVIVYGDSDSVEKRALLEFATAVMNNEPFTKEDEYEKEYNISVSGGCSRCTDLKSDDLHEIMVAFSSNPSYEKSLRKEFEKLKEKPIFIFSKSVGKIFGISTIDEGFGRELKRGETIKWDTIISTTNEKEIVSSFFEKNIEKKRSYFVEDYKEEDDDFHIGIGSNSVRDDYLIFNGFNDHIFVIELNNSKLFVSKEGNKINIGSDFVQYLKVYGKNNCIIADGQGKRVKDLNLTIVDREGTQVLTFANFTTDYVKKNEKKDYRFYYEKKEYLYKDVPHNTKLTFDPTNNNFGLGNGKLIIKEGKKELCELGGGVDYISLRIEKEKCNYDYIIVHKGRPYDYIKDGKSILTVIPVKENVAFFTMVLQSF